MKRVAAYVKMSAKRPGAVCGRSGKSSGEDESVMNGNLKNGCVALDDTEMYYVSFGTGEKNLVVLPGLSDGLATVKGKAWMLAPSYRNFLKDYTVYLFSRKNRMPEGYAIRQMSEDQFRVLGELGVEKTGVLGVSQGGMIAQFLAADHPELVQKLVLAVTAPYANARITETVSGWIGMAERRDHTALMTDTAERMYSQAFLARYRRLIPALAKFTRPADYERFLRNACAILDFDAREELKRISCPTLILSGENDKVVGRDAAYELNHGISGSELYVYTGLGHGAFEEAKDFYERVREFCDRAVSD